ncbi:MAG: hypothetical protein IPM84_04715 [Anaerolineae bacterium]|nr:hypothetical protein [Anaerolineae bacterium]
MINVLPGVTFDIQNDQALVYNGGQRPTFNNAGTVTESAGAGTSRIDMIFNNTGTLNLRAGTFQINSGGSSSGPFQVQAGATLNFSVDTYTFAATATVANAGAVRFSSGTVTVNGAFSGAGSVTVNGGTATFAGAYTATGPVTLSSGNLIFNAPNGVSLPTFTQSNGTLDGAATVTVNGALSWSGGTMSGSGRTVAQWPADPRRPGQVPGQAHPGHCVWRDVVGRQSHRDKHRRRDQRAAGRHLRHSE